MLVNIFYISIEIILRYKLIVKKVSSCSPLFWDKNTLKLPFVMNIKMFFLRITENLLEYVTTMVCIAVKGVPVIGIIHKPFVPKQTYWAWAFHGSSKNLQNLSSVSITLHVASFYVSMR